MCIFCEIARENSDKFLFETDNFYFIKDINPQTPVHILCVSKEHFIAVNDLSKNLQESLIKDILKFCKLYQIKEFSLTTRNGKSVGQEIEHFHMHINALEKLG